MFSMHTDAEQAEMLREIGVASLDDLLTQVPNALRCGDLGWPGALSPPELLAHARELAAKNRSLISFAGAGAQDHYVPAAVRSLIARGEFMTAYTPYQAEASQGLLQSIYEFQSSISVLMGMDAANASLYDGATALAEAVQAAVRKTRRQKVLLPATLHPEWRAVLETNFRAAGEVRLETVPHREGLMDRQALERCLDETVAALVVATPNHWGLLEDGATLVELVHAQGALVIAAVDPVSLGVLAPPGEWGADIAVAEGQGLGNSLNYGGPYLGLFACKKELLRSMPGRICGRTVDSEGRSGFVLTLQAREQHIRRERASSNVCSNEALCALAATIHLALLGPYGLREAAELCLDRAHRLAERLAKLPGFSLPFPGPFFNEFVLECPVPASQVLKRLQKAGILGGVSLADSKNRLLVCVTEMRTEAEMDRYVAALEGEWS